MMNFVDYLIIAVIAVVIAGACFAIYRSKKSGKKCIGCPNGAKCGGSCSGCAANGTCGCHGTKES